MVWCGVVWCGVVWCGVVWCGVVWLGSARLGSVWFGSVRFGLTRLGLWFDHGFCCWFGFESGLTVVFLWFDRVFVVGFAVLTTVKPQRLSKTSDLWFFYFDAVVSVLCVSCVVVLLAVWLCGWSCVCGVCGVSIQNPPCVHPKRLCVYIQNVPVCASTTSTCIKHVDVVPVHRGDVFECTHRRFGQTHGGKEVTAKKKKKTHVEFPLSPEKFTKETLGPYPFQV